jgi:hypothetical protein
VSTIDELPAESGEAKFPPGMDGERPGAGLSGWIAARRRLLVGVAVIGLLGGAAAAWFDVRSGSAPAASTPIELPDTMAGLPDLGRDPLHAAQWQQKAAQAAAGTAWVARTYGSAGPAKTIRLVVARTDLSGKLEQAWAVGSGTQVGSDRCTHNTRITPGSKPRVRPTVLVCWRTSPSLSAYALVIDPKATAAIPDADGAAAVDAAWRAAGGAD